MATRKPKQQQVYQAKQQGCSCIMLFLYVDFLLLHDYDVKMPNFTFYGECKPVKVKVFFCFQTWAHLGTGTLLSGYNAYPIQSKKP